MYELLIKEQVIILDPTKRDLAERFYVSGMMEYSRFNRQIAEEESRFFSEAQRRWGQRTFISDNNWALPIFPNERQVTFKDLERFVGADDMRHMYLEGNVSVHAGALPIMQSADFRRANIFETRGQVDLHFTGRVGHVCSFLLREGSMDIARVFAREFEQWDLPLEAAQFLRRIDQAAVSFFNGYSPEPI
jgi:hypothetical protein